MEDDDFGDLYTDIPSFPSIAAHPIDLIPPNSDSNPNLIENQEIRDSNLIEKQQDEERKPNDEDEDIPIPGLGPGPGPGLGHGMGMAVAMGGVDNNRSESDSDDDSDDDLQIVLNDNEAPNGGIMSVDDGNDGFMIMADDDSAAAAAAATDDPDWADDNAAADPAAVKPLNPPRPYHPFHSQFKYVRPGAAPLPAAGSAGAPMTMPSLPGAGRGRGDFRPPAFKAGVPMHKGFVPPHWGPNAPARGLDFTLPSHKTIFDFDIDNFEEKPWKHPGVDVSDYFNFNLNEESWKDYCKQLEQLRLESTMQSKIRVYESGRTEQEYDPDLPHELVAAAAAMNDSAAENGDTSKVDGGLGDPAKAAACARPMLPTGRAIQVETGYGERLPSVDARPPRLRDSDSVIEIVLQDSADNGDTTISDNDSYREDEQVDVDKNDPLSGTEDSDGHPHRINAMTEDVAGKRSPVMDSSHVDVHDKERERSLAERASSDHHSGSKDHDSTEYIGSPREDRWAKDRAREQSPHMSSGESEHSRRSLGHQREHSSDSMEQKHSPESVSLAHVEDAVEASMEGKSLADDDFVANHKSRKEKENGDMIAYTDTSKKKYRMHSTKPGKPSCQVEPSATEDVNDREDVKASRSSDTSKATGNSRDNQKWREGIDEEVVQNNRSVYMGDVKRNRGEVGHDSRRKHRDDRLDKDRNYVSVKGRDDYYSHKEQDFYTVDHFPAKLEGGDRRRERDNPEASWQRQDDDPHGRRVRAEDAKKQQRGDDMVSRHRRKVRETPRSDKDEYLQSQFSEDVKTYHEKDAGLRYREKDDISKSRHETLDDHYGNRRKDDDYMRDHVDKPDRSLGLRESTSSRGKRDREVFLNQQKRDDHSRVRDTYDNHHAVRMKDESWVQRERAEQQRDREEWYRTKQCYEENLSRRDREEGRAPIRSSRPIEDKLWVVGHSHGREEYKSHDKDAGRHGDQIKRRERVEEELSLQHRGAQDAYARGNQTVADGRRPRQEKSAARNDRTISAADQKFLDKKLKDKSKRPRESEGHNTSGLSKRHQGEKGVPIDTADVKGLSEKDVAENGASLDNLSRDDVSRDDKQQDTKRGRSKLERWASHKDRDLDVNSKSSSLKIKETSRNRNTSGSTSLIGDESTKNVEESLGAVKESGEGSEAKDAVDGRHLDAVERLKRRRERFKQELPSEKDTPAIKKTENESIPETPVNPQVKQERPPRKRRWLSS
ncbi:FIP1[V]-like protein [Silene latifolia]|uniref:FIP1[V]-like protein n=1 Tax=Silene latifolia TaxID=37657 RepID=UPI003D76FA6D